MLKFCNSYPSTVWVTIMWYHPDCPDGGNWEKAGWWKIVPGACKVVFGDDLDDVNRYWCFYAEAADGAVWSGPYVRSVPHQAFDWCEWTSQTGARQLGYRQFDINGYDDYTATLVP